MTSVSITRGRIFKAVSHEARDHVIGVLRSGKFFLFRALIGKALWS